MNLLSDALARPDFDLRGTHLVSASAGTGKTYSIQSLYLRLLLTQGLTVRQVLVVTFTEAATRELRDRLRRVLLEAVRFLDGHPGPHEPRIAETVARVPAERHADARLALRQALIDFDLASIHTIHGFCLRTLSRFAFETGQSFDATPSTEAGSEIQRLCEDWWRRHAYPAPAALAKLFAQANLTLASLASLARKRIAKPDASLKPEPVRLEDLPGRLAAILAPVCDLQVPAPPEGTPVSAPGRRVCDALFSELEACRTAAAQADWTAAAAALLAARTHSATEPPWPLPDALAAWRAACSRCVAACAGRQGRTFHLEDGRLRSTNPLPPDFDTAEALLRTTGESVLAPFLQALDHDPHAWPRRPTQAARAAEAGLRVLLDFARGAAGLTGNRVLDAIRAADKGLDQLPDARTLSLATLAPDWERTVPPLEQALSGLLTGAAEEVGEAYRAGRPARTALTFDDYLLNLRDALEGPHAPALTHALRGEYRAALIDEFQDTDPVQYGIFRRIFREPVAADGPPCFLVGDPKQAIYRFRNGDIETYRSATASVPEGQRHELNRNFRSEARLITAVNQLFGDRPRGEFAHTFRMPEMAYDGSLEAQGKPIHQCLTVAGAVDPQPFKLWFFEGELKRVPGIGSPLANALFAQTAAEIRRLLHDDATRIGGQRVRPGQVAVLVMRHQEAEAVEAELSARGVPSVRQGTASVFDAPEALEFRILVAAMAEPREVRRVRAALASGFLGLTHGDLQALNAGGAQPLPPLWPVPGGEPSVRTLEGWVAFFETLHDRWIHAGFAAAFQVLAMQSGLRTRAASRPRGERHLTNLLHLAELLHGAALSGRLSIEGTLAWLQRQLNPATRLADEAHELRLDTDEDAVQILTVFKSKGLEFPIVFIPSLLLRKAQAKRLHDTEIEYHLPEGRLAIEAGTQEGAAEALRESFEEDIRLAYVAATRAVHRTVLAWAALPVPPDQQALAWLLGDGSPANTLRTRFGGDLAIAVEHRSIESTEPTVLPLPPRDASAHALTLPAPPTVEKRFGHGSFSTLAPHADDGPRPAAPPSTAADVDAATADPIPEAPPSPDDNPLFDFPAGAKTGTCWHALFETLPFDASDAQIRAAAGEQLGRYGLLQGIPPSEGERRLAATARMVRRVLETPLPALAPGATPFRLRDVAGRDRRNEWEFSFPAAPWTRDAPVRTGALAALLRQAWGDAPDRAQFLDRLAGWDQPLPGGYLTGFVDLLFRHGNRYYLVDWKSNRRGGRAADFAPDGLRQEMALHAYFLQYLFYCVAVHQFLKASLAGYAYGRHFGGVHYLFLRGVDGTPARGIYSDRPSEDLIEGLSALLGRFA